MNDGYTSMHDEEWIEICNGIENDHRKKFGYFVWTLFSHSQVESPSNFALHKISANEIILFMRIFSFLLTDTTRYISYFRFGIIIKKISIFEFSANSLTIKIASTLSNFQVKHPIKYTYYFNKKYKLYFSIPTN